MREDNPLQTHEFYGKYANMPVSDRDLPEIETSEEGVMTASEIYKTVAELDNRIRRDTSRRDTLIADASKFIREHQS